MLTGSSETIFSSMTEDEIHPESACQEILEQLERVTGSSLFRHSRRYPLLLRYIVEEAVAGRADALKERTLGMCVFGREANYDTNADPVVRTSAGEVRRRIAQYYQTRGNEHELRIDIPLGSYQPRFYRPSRERWSAVPLGLVSPVAEDESKAKPLGVAAFLLPSAQANEEVIPLAVEPVRIAPPAAIPPRGAHKALRFAISYSLLFLALVALGLLGWRTLRTPQPPPAVALFWGPFLRSPEPTLIIVGVHSFDAVGNDISDRSHVVLPQTQQTLLSAMTRSDMVHLSDLTSYAALTTLLTQHSHPFLTQGAADVTLDRLRHGPFILVGGFNNLWTRKLTQRLRFRFVTLKGGHNVIQDSEHPERTWTVDTSQLALSDTRDYGMVSCYFDAETNQYVLIAAGIGKSGTEAASEFLTREQGLTSWLESTKTHAGTNVQVILATDVIEGQPGSPYVVDYVRW